MESILEEVEVINSIYEDTVEYSRTTSTVLVQIPDTSVHVKLWLPGQYPDDPPRIINISGVHTDTDVVQRFQEIVDNTFVPGEVYLYTFIDEARGEAERLEEEEQKLTTEELNNIESRSNKFSRDGIKGSQRIAEWATSAEIRDRGSVFTGRAIRVTSEQDMEDVVSDLLCDKKLSQATHNMVAWRIPLDDSGCYFSQDYDNDGESGAGTCMLHVLEMANVQNVVVVVTRFYGGVHLGGDRFKHIKNCTRNALTVGGFINK